MFLGSIYYGLQRWFARIVGQYYDLRGRVFDARHGVRTEGQVPVPDLDIPESFRSSAIRYQPTKVGVFFHLMNQLPVKDLREFAFVDFGCGKGRCLLLATQFPFGRIVGIDLSESLCAIARTNARHFMGGQYNSQIDIQCCPSVAARLPRQPSVYYFYNPFDEQLMADTLRSIDELLVDTGVEAYSLYITPQHTGAFLANGFRLLASGRRCGEEWTLWHRRAAGRGIA